jgi:hypothetical protein
VALRAGEIWGLAILRRDLAALRVLEQRDEAHVRATEALALRPRDRRGAGWCLHCDDRRLPAVRAAAAGAAAALFRSVGATGQVTLHVQIDTDLT